MRKLLLTAALALSAAVCAQNNVLSIDAQLRTRGEHDNGAHTPRSEGTQAANFISERARLSFNYNRQDLQLKASIQHTGLWGQDGMNTSNERATVNEAWAKMKFGNHFFAQLGRMQLAYDDERILGASDWNNNGNWHDALRLGYSDFHNSLHIILAMNQDDTSNRGDYYNGPMPYKNMQALWYHYQAFRVPFSVSLMALNIGYERGTENHGRTNYLQTYGTDINFRPQSWNIHAAFYYQMGKTSLRKVQAWLASGSIGYSFAPELGLSVGYDLMSGNDYNKNEWTAFDALYGTHHKFFGTMDYFGSTLSCGLQDLNASLTSKLSHKVKLKVDYHYLMTDKQLNTLGKSLGHEIDAQVTANIMKDVTLTAGYSTMLGTVTMDYVKGGSHDQWQDWAWLQLNINPRLFSSKW